MTLPLDDDMTELVDAQIDRVDLVASPANGRPFVLMKAAAPDGLTQPLIPADMVSALIAKADSQETPAVTDPAPTDTVAKDAPPVEVDDLMPTAPGGSTAESLPGSPDWEQLDGDTAMSTVAVLGRVKSVLAWLSDREAQEAVTGGDYDADGNSWDLDSMACQIDYIIGCLAGFAAGEHLEAGMADELEAVGKAVASVAAPLAVVEGLAPIAKAGRTLPGANEAKIRTAVDSLTEVLNSLPAAPAADDVTKETAVAKDNLFGEVLDKVREAAVVTKETAPENTTGMVYIGEIASGLILKGAKVLTDAEAFIALRDGGRAISKAKGDPQMAVFSAEGKLVGVIDPADLNPIAATEAPAAGDTEGTGDDAPAADDAAAPADDTAATPAAPDAAADQRVVPGTDTVQAPAQAPDDQTPAVAKTAADPATLEEIRAQVTEDVRKGVEAEIAELREQVRKMGLLPDDRRSPLLNGATGTPGAVARDTTADSPLADVLKTIAEETDPVKKDELRKAAFFAGVKARFEQS